MRLASFEHKGRQSFGIVTRDGLVDIPKREQSFGDLVSVLQSDEVVSALAPFEEDEPDYGADEVTFLPVIPRPGKLIGVGLNYRDHAAELGAKIPTSPELFVRFADSLVGHRQPLLRPNASKRFDYEGELAVIIGRSGRRVRREQALAHVAGYCCFNDGTIRDWQGHSSQYTAGKNFVRTGAMGPWMVTADCVRDPGSLSVMTRLNDDLVQDGRTANMVFDVPALIEYITTFTELRPGDVIATGTPAGVGVVRKPALYLKASDVVEIEIDGVGTLRNTVVDEN